MALAIPSMLLKQLYTFGSLRNENGSVKFSVKNRLSDATLTGLESLKFDGQEVPLENITLDLGDGNRISVADLAADTLNFPLRRELVRLMFKNFCRSFRRMDTSRLLSRLSCI